jgi:uncharacterized protein YgbK (DUF1537 family)
MSARPLLAYYGDDLTGSTDVMEALALRGIATVLFTGIPDDAVAARFAGRRAVGLAGTSRSETPAWMDANLPAAFSWLKRLQPELCHYKVCSTFDSSPTTGSIGRAIEIGARVFGQASTPIVVGAPQLRRYTAFGNLFASFRGETFRIDRHPVMSRHPVTPMREADLRLHLASQTDLPVGLVDLVALTSGLPDAAVDEVFDRHPVVLLDVMDGTTQTAAGRHLWRRRHVSPFVVGSSGVEYALAAEAAGTPLSGRLLEFPRPGRRGPVAVVSGSCSPTTARQIAHAVENGFVGVSVDPAVLASGEPDGEIARAVETGSAVLATGASPLLHTALGAETTPEALRHPHRVGRGLGRILRELIDRHGLGRAMVAGGDTSSHAIAELAIVALECRMPLADVPGSPLCLAHRAGAGGDDLDLAFKGGQIGGDDYFARVRDL